MDSIDHLLQSISRQLSDGASAVTSVVELIELFPILHSKLIVHNLSYHATTNTIHIQSNYINVGFINVQNGVWNYNIGFNGMHQTYTFSGTFSEVWPRLEYCLDGLNILLFTSIQSKKISELEAKVHSLTGNCEKLLRTLRQMHQYAYELPTTMI